MSHDPLKRVDQETLVHLSKILDTVTDLAKSTPTSTETGYLEILRALVSLFNAEAGALWWAERGGDFVPQAWYGTPPLSLPLPDAWEFPLTDGPSSQPITDLPNPWGTAFPHHIFLALTTPRGYQVLLAFAFYAPAFQEDRHLQLITSISRHISASLERVHLTIESLHNQRTSQALVEAILALEHHIHLQDVLNELLIQLERVIPYTSAAVLLAERDWLIPKAGRGFPDLEAAMNMRFSFEENRLYQTIAAQRKPIVIEDVHKHPDWTILPPFKYIHAWIGVPLLVRGRVIGMLTIDNETPGAYTEEDAKLAMAFAAQAALAVERARLFDETRRRADQQALLVRMARELSSILDPEKVSEKSVEQLHTLFRLPCVGIYMVRGDRDLYLIASRHDQTITSPLPEHVPANDPIIGKVASQGKPIHIERTEKDESLLALPITLGRRTLGVLFAQHPTPFAFDEMDIEILETIAAQLAIVIENSQLYRQVQEQANQLSERVAERTRELEVAIEELFKREQIQRRISAELAEINRQLEATRKYLSAVLESAADGIVVTDAGGKVMLVNPMAGAFLGLPPLSIRDKHLNELPHLNARLFALALQKAQESEEAIEIELVDTYQPETIPCWQARECEEETCPLYGRVDAKCWASQDSPAMEHIDQCLTCPYFQKLRKRTVTIHAAPILDEEAKQIGTVTVIHDITRLKELDRMRADFVSTVSHELRTPLTNLKLYLSLLKDGREEKRARYFQIASAEVDRLTRLIQDLLDLSRLERGERAVRRERLRIESLVTEVIDLLRPQAEAKSLQLKSSLHCPDLILEAERDLIIQLLTNLLGNAIQYTPSGEVEVGIAQVTNGDWPDGIIHPILPPPGNWCALWVRDTGIGIPEEDLPHIFERFYRGKQVRIDTRGTGLGLAIVQEILERHNGTIRVWSREGEGSLFIAFLPLQLQSVEKAEEKPIRATALIVDDEETVGHLVIRILNRHNIRAHWVPSAPRALSWLETNTPPDLIILDLMMPQMDGYALLEQLQANPTWSTIPVLVLSSATIEDGPPLLEIGAADFLSKPFSPQALISVVNRLLGQRTEPFSSREG